MSEDSSTDLDSEATDIARDRDDSATSDSVKLGTLATSTKAPRGNPHLNVRMP